MNSTRTPGVRGRNLADVLRLVHQEGPLSRAALTRRTGLNRSTIGDLVQALAAAGLVHETEPEPNRRVGRPSPQVSASPDVVVVAANPEVDALTVALIGLDRGIRVRRRLEYDASPSPDDVARMLGELVREWQRDAAPGVRVVAGGIAVPGLVRAGDGVVRTAPHLGWRDVAVQQVVHAALGMPVVVANDADLGVIAEHRFGAARGVDDVVYLNGGAGGIGGGLIVGGVPVVGARGYAGELGQARAALVDDADRRTEGGRLEDEVSRRRLLDVAGLRTADEPALAAALAAPRAAAVDAEIARQRRVLATALAGAADILNPAVIVLGGFLATLLADGPEALAADVRAQAMPDTGEDLQLRPAALAEDRLLIGAAEAAFAALLRDPRTAM